MSKAKIVTIITIYIIFHALWLVLPTIAPATGTITSITNPQVLPYGATLAILFVLHIALIFAIYKDAKSKGINENWYFISLFLGWVGGIIYLLVNRNKGASA